MLNVALIGLGLMGSRRARAIEANPRSTVTTVFDVDAGRRAMFAGQLNASAASTWLECLRSTVVDAVVICTPNAVKDEISLAAIRAGKHVLTEKPAAVADGAIERILLAQADTGALVKVGFNYRYFRGLADAVEIVQRGGIGDLLNYRIRHGHGAAPGYQQSWRFDPSQSGGGQLMDQGCHAIDLATWIAGPATGVSCELQAAFWDPGGVEDNAFLILRHTGVVGQVHVSWTQWQNLFSVEVFGTSGSLIVEGLGGSYGVQTLTTHLRSATGGRPKCASVRYADDADVSLAREWDAFLNATADPDRWSREWGNQAVENAAVIRAAYAAQRQGGRASALPQDKRSC